MSMSATKDSVESYRVTWNPVMRLGSRQRDKVKFRRDLRDRVKVQFKVLAQN